MAKSSLRFIVAVLSTIFSNIEASKARQSDYSIFIQKFEEKLYPLLELVYQMDHQRARECFQKGESFETIEEYLMVVLCMLVVKGFNDLSRNIPELEHLDFDIKVDEDDSTNLERGLEAYPYDLKEALNENIKIRDYQRSLTEGGNDKKEEDFPEYEEKASQESKEDFNDSSPRFNNLYYQQQTKEYESKETQGNGQSNVQGQSEVPTQESEENIRTNNQILNSIEEVLLSRNSDQEQSNNILCP
jgi:hypothetical protein